MSLREVLAKFGIEVEGQQKLDAASKKADGFKLSLQGIAGMLGGSMVVGAIKDMVGELADMSEKLRKTSVQTGLTTEELQKWGHAEASVEDLANGVKFLQKNAFEAATKGGDAATVFAKLGVAFKDANGQVRPTGELLREAGFAIADIKNPAERTARALDIFGRGGLALVPVFAKGKEALAGAFDEFERLGGGLSKDAIDKLEEYDDTTRALNLSFLTLKSRLASQLIPALTDKTRTLTRVVAWIAKATQGTNLFKAAALLLGSALSKLAYGMLAPFAKLFLVFAALTLVVDDFLTFVKGGDSIVGAFLDKLLGTGAGKSIAADMRADFAALWTEIEKAPSVGDKLEAAFGTVGASLVRFFVDDIPEAVALLWPKLTAAFRGFLFGTDQTFSQWWGGFSDRVAGAFRGLYDRVKELAGNVVTGLADAFRSGAEKVSDAFETIAKAILDRVKEFFGIHSPSKVMFRIGGYIDEGLANGIAAGATDVRNATEGRLAPAALPSSRAFAPLRMSGPAYGRGALGGPVRIEQRNTISVTVQGSGLGGVADAAREGVARGLTDERDALLEALEPVAAGAD